MSLNSLSVFEGLRAAIPPLDPGFPEWLTFILTLIIIVLAYGLRFVRSKSKKQQHYMQQADRLESDGEPQPPDGG